MGSGLVAAAGTISTSDLFSHCGALEEWNAAGQMEGSDVRGYSSSFFDFGFAGNWIVASLSSIRLMRSAGRGEYFKSFA